MNNITALVLRRMRAPLLVLIAAYSISMLGFVLIPGIDNHGNVYRMDFLHAFYFVGFTASTTGFGEIPYPFTEHQRMWTMLSMYLTVVSWFYSIGSIFAIIREPAFKYVLTRTRFKRQIEQMHEPFYLICGYGDTGGTVVNALNRDYVRCSVLDMDEDAINRLSLDSENVFSPGLVGDIRIPDNLIIAGLHNPHCQGVMALTNEDHSNLSVAITAKLLRPQLPVICRADTPAEAANMDSFGTDHIISAFDYFADRLTMSMANPELQRLKETLALATHSTIPELRTPPTGHWIICGFGLAGQAVYNYFQFYGIKATIIERDDSKNEDGITTWVSGRGTEANTLRAGGLDHAVGVFAATEDDADNLSIVMTARQERPDIYIVAKQNQRQNALLFQKAHIDWIMQPWQMIGDKITTILRAQVLADFLKEARNQPPEWVNPLMEHIIAINHRRSPEIWSISINEVQCPAVAKHLQHDPLTLEQLIRDPRERDRSLNLIPLMLSRNNQNQLLPKCDLDLVFEDKILFCGDAIARARLDWSLVNHNALSYITTGDTRPDGTIWRWFRRDHH